jgi:hypothetical protein
MTRMILPSASNDPWNGCPRSTSPRRGVIGLREIGLVRGGPVGTALKREAVAADASCAPG